jgi:hypothetical protein
VGGLPGAAGLAVVLHDVVGHPERLVLGQAQDRLGDLDLVLAQGVAVGVGRVGELGRRVADVAAQDEQRGPPVGLVTGPAQRRLERVEVVGDLAQVVDPPAVRLEAPGGVVGVGQLGLAVDGDVVVVVDGDEAVEPLVAGEGGRLVADALHHVAVAADDPGVVVAHLGAELGAQPALGHGEADGVADALAQRAGRDLDTLGVVHLGVAGGGRAPLAERLDVVQRQAVPGEVQHGVEEDRGVAGGEDEPVAVGPVRVVRVVLHDAGPQHVGEGGQGHRRARVAVLGGLRGVHGEATDDVDGTLLEGGVDRHARPTLLAGTWVATPWPPRAQDLRKALVRGQFRGGRGRPARWP